MARLCGCRASRATLEDARVLLHSSETRSFLEPPDARGDLGKRPCSSPTAFPRRLASSLPLYKFCRPSWVPDHQQVGVC